MATQKIHIKGFNYDDIFDNYFRPIFRFQWQRKRHNEVVLGIELDLKKVPFFARGYVAVDHKISQYHLTGKSEVVV